MSQEDDNDNDDALQALLLSAPMGMLPHEMLEAFLDQTDDPDMHAVVRMMQLPHGIVHALRPGGCAVQPRPDLDTCIWFRVEEAPKDRPEVRVVTAYCPEWPLGKRAEPYTCGMLPVSQAAFKEAARQGWDTDTDEAMYEAMRQWRILTDVSIN